jgi:cytochrome c-type biogenesis protein CcmH/NrfF
MTNHNPKFFSTRASASRQGATLQVTEKEELSVRTRREIFYSQPGKSLLKRTGFLLAILALASGPLLTAQLGYSPQAKNIGMHLKCMCRGCDMSAGGCAHPGGAFSGPCDTAKSMLKEVDEHLAKGDSEQQIIDAFVAQYGTVVYVEPPKKGFGLVAWLLPVFYSIFGFGLVIFVVRKWAVRPRAISPAGSAVHSEAMDRARAQAARETED